MFYFGLNLGLKISFEHRSARKSKLLSARRCWDASFSLREMEQKFNLGGSIGYMDSYMEFIFSHSKVYRLHATLHDAAGVVRSPSAKGRGYC